MISPPPHPLCASTDAMAPSRLNKATESMIALQGDEKNGRSSRGIVSTAQCVALFEVSAAPLVHAVLTLF